ncbi:ssDNA-binding protein [Pectobacterium phage POP12]|nr:ssDNA-binding protein [Pectobacterium phage POP12]
MSGLFKRQDPAKLQQQLNQLKGSSGYQKDEKEWRPTIDAQGNGSAVIRFLPARSDDELAFVNLITHGFKENGNWYINNCPATHGDYDGCPVCKYITEQDLFERAKVKGSAAEKMLIKIGRKKGYWANILVIKDPASPENEGKVFKYRFGTKIMDKINAQINVDASLGEIPVDVTCPFGGASLKLKIKKVGGFTNYDDTVFNNPSEIDNITDEAFQKYLFENMSDLRPINAKDQFKSFDELNKLFTKAMGASALVGGAGASAAKDLDSQLEDFDESLKDFDNSTSGVSGGGAGAPAQTSTQVPDDDDTPPFSTGSEDDDLNALLDDL